MSSHRRFAIEGIACLDEEAGYAGGSIAPGRASPRRKATGDEARLQTPYDKSRGNRTTRHDNVFGLSSLDYYPS
jgi:hypothetical protein